MMNSQPSLLSDDQRTCLSALMDGDADAADKACGLWRADAQARADWHTYHLIGDVLRSEEHAGDASRDARLLRRVREQLATEPVVLAPTAEAHSRPTRRASRWMAPAAVAAGFVVVAGALLVTQVAGPGAAPQDVVARSAVAPSPATQPVLAATSGSVAAQVPVEGATMIRNTELDRYLAAHRQYISGAVQMAPLGGVRNAAAVAPSR